MVPVGGRGSISGLGTKICKLCHAAKKKKKKKKDEKNKVLEMNELFLKSHWEIFVYSENG